jgi:Xaa-Pro aminopeptidase
MAKMDQTRIERIQKMMAGEGLAALVCRLSENVLYLTDYWPHHGFSVAILPQEGRPQVLVPEVEQEYAVLGWAEVTPFGWGLLKDGDMYANFRQWLEQKVQNWA